MPLTNAEKQKRWRERRNALAKRALGAPAIRKPLMQQFGDGKWHKLSTMAKHVGASAEQVEAALSWSSNHGDQARIERRRHGKEFEFRIFKGERTVSTVELVEKLTPIIEDLQAQSERPAGTLSRAAICSLVGQLRNLLAQWRE